VAPVNDDILGPAQHITASYQSTDQAVHVAVDLVVATHRPALIYQVEIYAREDDGAPTRFALLDDNAGGLGLAGPIEYLALRSTGQIHGTLTPGGSPVNLSLAESGPLLLRSDAEAHAYVLALLDEGQGRTVMRLTHTNPSELLVRLETGARVGASTVSPRLFIERTDGVDVTEAFAGYRAALDVIAPVPPLPATFRQQWDSWYVYGGDLDEALLREQIDTIARTYGDIGPWQIVIDAGWYRAGADPAGEMGLVDLEKFPSGMRALVDYAHERGVGVVLYGSAPWVDSDPSIGSWWVVQLGFVRDHPDWLILVSGDEDGATYVYDLANPELRAYLAGLIRRYLIEFEADGILLDMVGIIGPEGGPFRGEVPGPPGARRPPLRGRPPGGEPPADPAVGRSPSGLAQTMEIYRSLWQTATRFKPDVWIESGYASPALARSYAHTWRLADDYPAFSHPYPFAGLLEQVTYAVLQQQILGRRPHLGFVYGGPETLAIQRQWLGAAVALQAQVVLSTDLTSLPPETARMYREYLVALRPFSARPVFGPGVPPRAFSTTVDGTTYLGLLNETDEPLAVTVNLAEHGLLPSVPALAIDPETGAAFEGTQYLTVDVPARSFRLLVLRTAPGVLWADRQWSSQVEQGVLRVQVGRGSMDSGRLQLYAPGAHEVRIEGGTGGNWTIDPLSGLLTADLTDGSDYRIEVEFLEHPA
jgi:hypothetical protein